MALSTTQYGYIIDPMVPFTDGKGKTIKDGFVRVFVAGSSTPVITYRNFDGAANQDRIELDNSGRTKTSVIGSKGLTYKVCVYDKHHSQESPILTVDKVSVIGANINAGAGATVVTGLDGLTTKPDGFVDASVVGTDGYVALDHTLVTDDLDTDAKVDAVENDRYIPLLNDDVNDPDSKMTLGRLWQWVLGKISNIATTITSFRSGDYIPVDGTSGTAKMSKDDLLRVTTEKALEGSDPLVVFNSYNAEISRSAVSGKTLITREPGTGPRTDDAVGSSIMVFKCNKGDLVRVSGLNNCSSANSVSVQTLSADAFTSSTTFTTISSDKGYYLETIKIEDEQFVAVTFDTGTTPLCKVIKTKTDALSKSLDQLDTLCRISETEATISRAEVSGVALKRVSPGSTPVTLVSAGSSIKVFSCEKGDTVTVRGVNNNESGNDVTIQTMSADAFLSTTTFTIISLDHGEYIKSFVVEDETFVAITFDTGTTPSCNVLHSRFDNLDGDINELKNDVRGLENDVNTISKIDGIEKKDSDISRNPVTDKTLIAREPGTGPRTNNAVGSSIMVFKCIKGDYVEVSGENNCSSANSVSVQTLSADAFTSSTTFTTISSEKGNYRVTIEIEDEQFVAITFDTGTNPSCKVYTNRALEYTVLQEENYAKGGVAEIRSEAMSDGDSLDLTDFPYCGKKGDIFNFRCNISGEFAGVKICRGYKSYRSAIFEITTTNVNLKWRENSGEEGSVVETYSHGLSIGTLLYVNIRIDDDAKAHFRMVSIAGSFDCIFDKYSPDANGVLKIVSQSDLTDCVLSATNKDFKCDVWLFGDSYFGVNDSRWVGYLKNAGYWNLYVNGLAGRASAAAYSDFSKALALGTPKYIMWGILGNDFYNPSNFYSYFDKVVDICKRYRITPIFITMANVLDRDGLYAPMDEYVVASGERYVDWAYATNPDGWEAGTTWYAGMLSEDGVHPTPLGASVLMFKVFEDFPEITECVLQSGAVSEDGGGDL